jgi:Predicted membrane protein (DUF2207) C-terminal domain/Predicted membrane protein (DUF2207) N-terminal domain
LTGALRVLFLLLFFVLFSAHADAQERITNFASDISIAADGTVTVRETIAVVAENDQIRRGIFRDIPTVYTDRVGNRVRVGFDVQEVQRDGRPEPYVVERLPNGQRVRIGSADVIIDRGSHSYLIVYRTNRQVGFFDNFDELNWNVTGNAWPFVIERAEALVHLPPGASPVQFDFYTGPQGAQGKNARAITEGNGIRFVTTVSLAPGEGLTVAIGFSKGAVRPPSGAENIGEFFAANASTIAGLAGLAAIGAYYFFAWLNFGRDPARGVIIPLYTPPKDFSAASVRFVDRMGYDRKTFAAALVAMAVKGYLKIVEDHGTYRLERTGTNETALAKPEAALARALFASGKRIELKNSNHTTVSRAINALRSSLKSIDEGVYFVTNQLWFYGGLAILVLSGLVTTLLADQPELAVITLVWLSAWTAGTSFLLHRTAQQWGRLFTGPGYWIVNLIAAIFSSLFALPFLFGLLFGLFALDQSLPFLTIAALLTQGVLAYVFYHLLKAPTLAGAKVRDQIDGFKVFLTAAEKPRLEVLHPPDVTPEVFEKYLPYAIALDVENEWSRKFEAEAARAGTAPDRQNYSPSWYSGSSFNRLGTTGFASSLGGAVAGATAAAATAPGSSSGSGGGGSSGGGGGGGGGGGW